MYIYSRMKRAILEASHVMLLVPLSAYMASCSNTLRLVPVEKVRIIFTMINTVANICWFNNYDVVSTQYQLSYR